MNLLRRVFLHLTAGAAAPPAVPRIARTQATIWQEELLALNPWASELWRRRCELVDDKRWNLFHVDQGGNDARRRWLAEFQTRKRPQAARCRQVERGPQP
jgi:hypothetical protein